MIVVDTNVISELMRAEPHPAVMAWMAEQPRAELYTTRIRALSRSRIHPVGLPGEA
jgi:predicted nucleic acid-binding protein